MWQDNIKISLMEMGCDDVELFDLTHNYV